jgi:hypothetical protein
LTAGGDPLNPFPWPSAETRHCEGEGWVGAIAMGALAVGLAMGGEGSGYLPNSAGAG